MEKWNPYEECKSDCNGLNCNYQKVPARTLAECFVCKQNTCTPRTCPECKQDHCNKCFQYKMQNDCLIVEPVINKCMNCLSFESKIKLDTIKSNNSKCNNKNKNSKNKNQKGVPIKKRLSNTSKYYLERDSWQHNMDLYNIVIKANRKQKTEIDQLKKILYHTVSYVLKQPLYEGDFRHSSQIDILNAIYSM